MEVGRLVYSMDPGRDHPGSRSCSPDIHRTRTRAPAWSGQAYQVRTATSFSQLRGSRDGSSQAEFELNRWVFSAALKTSRAS
jgi:hypothetical protein